MGAAITGWGKALPSGELTNSELADKLDVTEDWILERTGISSRRTVAGDETTSSLATAAGAEALRSARVDAASLDMIIVATVTPDLGFPSTASLVQAELGASCAAFDLGAGCSGFLYALAQAQALIDAGASRKVLVCGADVLSSVTDYSDPSSCVLFGDGAGAVVVEAVDGPSRVGPFILGSDGSRPELLYLMPGRRVIRMAGREVYKRAVASMTRSVREMLALSGHKVSDVDLFVAHQANGRILEAVVERVGFTNDQVISNIAELGNTSAGSIPIALAEAAGQGRLQEDGLVLFTAFGAGFTWGAGIVRWGSGLYPPGSLTIPEMDRSLA